jgi:hypothetical protein
VHTSTMAKGNPNGRPGARPAALARAVVSSDVTLNIAPRIGADVIPRCCPYCNARPELRGSGVGYSHRARCEWVVRHAVA